MKAIISEFDALQKVNLAILPTGFILIYLHFDNPESANNTSNFCQFFGCYGVIGPGYYSSLDCSKLFYQLRTIYKENND